MKSEPVSKRLKQAVMNGDKGPFFLKRIEKQMDRLIMLEQSSPLELTIKMPEQLQKQTQYLARQRGETVSDIIRIALTHYLDGYRKAAKAVKPALSLEQGRNLMRELAEQEKQREQQAKILAEIDHYRVELPSQVPDSTTLLREDRDR